MKFSFKEPSFHSRPSSAAQPSSSKIQKNAVSITTTGPIDSQHMEKRYSSIEATIEQVDDI
jgi:hypothetical protein